MPICSNLNAGEILDKFLWRNRVIVISTPSPANPLFKKQLQLLDSETTDLIDRDLVILKALLNTGNFLIDEVSFGSSEKLLSKFNLPKSEFCLILLGKDGTVKFCQIGKLVRPQVLFSLIDSMPMRKHEIRVRNRADNQ
tara:strand:- start:501 stop:917 length:417 start_codon:yes stop_codon:yes gene_type:complete